MLKKNIVLSAVLVVALAGVSHAVDNVLTMSTTTSTQASGLLDVLLPEFKSTPVSECLFLKTQ